MRTSSHLTEGPILRSMLKLAIPIVISSMLQTMYQMIDTFWVGRLSAEAVAAVSLSFPINFLLIAIGGGLPMAGTVLVAQYRGRGDMQAVNHVAAQTFLLVVTISLALSGIGYMFATPIMKLMGAAPNVLPDAVLFLKVTFLGFIFVFGYFVFESLMRGLGEVRIPMYIVSCTVLLNFILDPLFIFGWKSFPPMGVAGAAMATLCTQALATVIGCFVLFKGKYGIHLRFTDFKPDFVFIRKAAWLGLPASIEQSSRALGMTVMTVLASSFGTIIVAAYGIGIRMLMIVIIPALGLSVATSTFVAQNIGAGKIDRAHKATVLGNVWGFIVLTITGVVLFIIARPLTLFFVPEGGKVIDLSVTFIRIIALTFGFINIQMVTTGTFRGAGQTGTAMAVAIIVQWLVQFPIAILLAFHTSLSFEGIWWSFTISNLVGAVMCVVWFMRGDWKKKKLLDEMEKEVHDEILIEERAG